VVRDLKLLKGERPKGLTLDIDKTFTILIYWSSPKLGMTPLPLFPLSEQFIHCQVELNVVDSMTAGQLVSDGQSEVN
jgi:hypothetical protein